MMKQPYALFLAASLGLSSGMFTFSAQAEEVSPAYPAYILGHLRAGNEEKDFVDRLPGLIERFDSDGDGLDNEDIKREAQRQAAQTRARKAQEMLSLDLNADNKVTREEAEAAWRPNRGSIASQDRRIDRLMEADTNRDGELSLNEALASVEPGRNCGPVSTYPAGLMTVDPNQDGRLTKEELQNVGRAIFASFDDNKDGVISTTEYSNHRNDYRRSPMGTGLPVQCLQR